MNFWDRLKIAIKERGLTQDRIAQKLKVPIGTFKNWLLRQTYPDAEETVELAKLLNTSAEYLVTGKDVSNISEEERRLITSMRKLSKCERDYIALIVEAWLKNAPRNKG